MQYSTTQPRWKALQTPAIADIDKVRIYEIGPREHTQQISTVARSANSLALAASIAASDPGSGIGAEAAGNYSRQAIGRAAALERVPSVVGYSQAGKSSFGWVIGPQAVLDPKGHIDMAQRLKTYDLSVELSVPGWWPDFGLRVTTMWGPSPRLLTTAKLSGENSLREFFVPLVRYSVDDFNSLTQYMLGMPDISVTIENIEGGPVNDCTKSNLLIRGKNVWRTEKVFLLGQLLETDAISILPDMNGILLSVPPISPPANGKFSENLRILTPFESVGKSFDEMGIAYVNETLGTPCAPVKPETEVPSDLVTISAFSPQKIIVPSTFDLIVTGTNLTKIKEVRFYGQKGNIKSNDGKSLTISFDNNLTSSIPTSDSIELKFFEKDEKNQLKLAITKFVRTQQRKN